MSVKRIEVVNYFSFGNFRLRVGDTLKRNFGPEMILEVVGIEERKSPGRRERIIKTKNRNGSLVTLTENQAVKFWVIT